MARRFPLREVGLAVAVAAGVLIASGLAGNSTVLRGLETASFDLRFRLRGPMPADPAIAIVVVDDHSLAELGRWPLSRQLYARAVTALKSAGAKVIVFDILFPEPEPSVVSPDERAAAGAAATGGAVDGTARAALQRLAGSDPDSAFATAIRAAGNVLLPVGFIFRGETGNEPEALEASAYAKFGKSPVEPVFPLRPTAVVPPIETLATAAAGIGEVELAYDLDGAPRYDYAAIPFSADFLPSMPIRAAAAYLAVPWPDVSLAPGSGVTLGRIAIPTDRAMRYLIDYHGPRGTFTTFSFADLIAGRVPASAFEGRIVLIGGSFLGNPDSAASPFGNTPLPGVERMGNIIATILHSDFISDVDDPITTLAATAAVLLMAALTGLAVGLLATRLALLAGVLPLLAWFAAAQVAFGRGVWLPMVAPLTALAAAAALPLFYRYWVVDRAGRQVRATFGRYMAPALVDILAEHPERVRLGGETRNMTLLFADIRGFTTISEGFKADPQGLTQLINRFLTPMTDVILARRGTIDKYMGDCVMAFWNAPLDDPAHAEHACESARAMMAALEDVNRDLRADAEASGRPHHPLRIGIGLNSGDCVVGNMGSERRFDYSVLGDAVNLASRLEGQSKTYGVDIVIGETTRACVPDWAVLELDRIAVKGKKEAVRIFALLGDPALAASPEHGALAGRHGEMLRCYRAQDWAGARAALADCRGVSPGLQTLYTLYEDRIGHYMAHPPGADWDGVFVATSK
ncbi:MAG TPA: adenylate/guanylate cyclase domain-containing protein [Alphaproteobacteria bacterium]|jgi:adenylate cyclase|nr:adenylate/guanylate cyclase domain-containing protein [Alphaproteobacteria bacterium]